MIQKIIDGRTDLILDFLEAGNAAETRDDYGTPLVRWCAYHGDVTAIRYLLRHGEALHSLGENLDLNGACFHGHWQLCQFLIEQGADSSWPDPHTGETPLHAALCKANRPAYDLVLEVLLAGGANPNSITTPNIETGSFMRDCRTRGETPLHRAAAFGTDKAVQLLLDAGAVVDAVDANGDTPLAWASWHLRPASILRRLCYDSHTINPANQSTYDHGRGWEVMGAGKPHTGNEAD